MHRKHAAPGLGISGPDSGRLEVELSLDDFDRIWRNTPYLVNVKPSGEFLMEDFFTAGGAH